MATAIYSSTASAVSMDGKQKIIDTKNNGSLPAKGLLGVASAPGTDLDKIQSDMNSKETIDIGPAYEVEISDKGKVLAINSKNEENRNETQDMRLQATLSDLKEKNTQDWRIQRDVARMKQAEQNIRTHEAAHMSAGGAFAGGVSYIYLKGPDGRMYITGGEVPIQAPEGKTPEETIKNMEIVRRAALAPADPSGQDLSVASLAMQIEGRARAALRQQRAAKPAEGEKQMPTVLSQPPVWPTSMAGLISTLMPQGGMISSFHSPESIR